MSIIRLPSADGAEYDLYAMIPDGVSAAAAKAQVDTIINATNFDYVEENGDSSIQKVLTQGLAKAGFRLVAPTTHLSPNPIDGLTVGRGRTMRGRQGVVATSIVWDSRIDESF